MSDPFEGLTEAQWFEAMRLRSRSVHAPRAPIKPAPVSPLARVLQWLTGGARK